MIAFGMFYSPSATHTYAEPAIVHVLESRSKRASALLASPPTTDVPALMRTTAEYTEAIAKVLPVDDAADAAIDALFARQERATARKAIRRG